MEEEQMPCWSTLSNLNISASKQLLLYLPPQFVYFTSQKASGLEKSPIQSSFCPVFNTGRKRVLYPRETNHLCSEDTGFNQTDRSNPRWFYKTQFWDLTSQLLLCLSIFSPGRFAADRDLDPSGKAEANF